MVQNIDIFPTVLELAGSSCPFGVQGKTLTGLLKNTEESIRDYAFSEEHDDSYHGAFAVRDQRYKLVYSEDGFEELYDLHNDPNEWRNIAGNPEMKSIIDELKNALLKWRFECMDRLVPEKGNFVKGFMESGWHRY